MCHILIGQKVEVWYLQALFGTIEWRLNHVPSRNREKKTVVEGHSISGKILCYSEKGRRNLVYKSQVTGKGTPKSSQIAQNQKLQYK